MDGIPLGLLGIGAHGRTTVVSVSVSESEESDFINNRCLCYIPTRPKSSSVLCVTVASDRICMVPLFALIVLVWTDVPVDGRDPVGLCDCYSRGKITSLFCYFEIGSKITVLFCFQRIGWNGWVGIRFVPFNKPDSSLSGWNDVLINPTNEKK